MKKDFVLEDIEGDIAFVFNVLEPATDLNVFHSYVYGFLAIL